MTLAGYILMMCVLVRSYTTFQDLLHNHPNGCSFAIFEHCSLRVYDNIKTLWNPYLYCGCKWKWRVTIAVKFPINIFRQLEGRRLKNIRASTGFEPVTYAILMRSSTNWAVKPHIGSEVNLLSSYLPVQWNDLKYIWNPYLYCGCRYSIFHIISLHGKIWSQQIKLASLPMNSTNWPRSQCVASQLSWSSIAPVSRRSRVWIPLKS